MANDPNLPPRGGGPDYNSQFGRMNINAHSFVPNAQVPAFIPRGGMPPGYPPQYGYPMHGKIKLYTVNYLQIGTERYITMYIVCSKDWGT